MSSVALDSRGPLSPNVSPRKAFKLRPEQLGLGGPPGSNGMPFCGGYVEDPFFDAGVAGGHVPMFRRSDPTTPMDTPVLDDKGGMFYHHQQMSSGNVANTSKATWPMATTTPQTDSHVAWSNAYATDSLDNQWWDGGHMDLSSNSQFQAQNARNATFNLAMHTQHSELPYEYNNIAAGHEMSGLMIHMPQPRTTSSPVIHYQPQQQQLHHQQHPQQMTERRPRMPRAPRPAPGTCHRRRCGLERERQEASVVVEARELAHAFHRKRPRRSAGGCRFRQLHPSDKNILMTGVAPSGSSKTKARREKEAMEKRRRLSEAAIKAVKAAGGDVDKLVEEGFVF
ncbi:developmental regulatory protein [Colletotrichum tofieldiae]|nr:developmental regulatory protein [Colletotrichum tofieldiae]